LCLSAPTARTCEYLIWYWGEDFALGWETVHRGAKLDATREQNIDK